MTEENVTAGAIPETKPDSVGSMLVNIFLEPMKVFRQIQIKPSWLVPFVIMVVVLSVVGMLTTPYQMDLQRQMIETSTDMQPQEQQRALDGMEMAAPFAHWIGLGTTFVFVILIFFVAVGVLMLMGNVILGGEASFKQIASAYGWASMIGVLGGIVKTALILWTGSADVRLSLAILLPADGFSSPLYGVLNSVTDIFFVWQMVVLIFGLAILYRFSKGRAAAVVLIPLAVIGGVIAVLSTAL